MTDAGDWSAYDYTVHELDSTCEWTGLAAAVTDVDVPARIVDWLEERAATAGA